MQIGVLALQGNFAQHQHLGQGLGLTIVPVRYPEQLSGLEGLILPGGESTAMTRLLQQNGFTELLPEFARTKPVLGTCAGLILMAAETGDSRVPGLGLLDVTVSRNAYGRQVFSFTSRIQMPGEESLPGPVTFIRAPAITRVGAQVSVLAEFQGRPVAVRQGHHIGLSFHPEIRGVTLFHELAFRPEKIPQVLSSG